MMDGTWDFFLQDLTVGDTITLNGNNGGSLPGEVTCFIFTQSDANPVQTFSIDLSGDQDLFLLDTFGSFQLEACDESDCMVEVMYEYTVVNTGGVDATVEKFEREREGDILDLLDGLPTTVVAPGSTTSASETEVVNYCLDAVYYTVVSVEAVPESGGLICPATADYEFEVNVGCRVDVEVSTFCELLFLSVLVTAYKKTLTHVFSFFSASLRFQISCVDENGNPCTDIVSPDGTCRQEYDGPVNLLQFIYNPSSCEEGFPTHSQPNPFCQDIADLPDGPVTIVCTAAPNGNSLFITPTTVSPGDALTITQPEGGPLPDQIYCVITGESSESANVYQDFSFYTSNGNDGATLEVKDQFGSLILDACINADGEGVDCIELVTYTYEISNVGPNDMDLSELERTHNNVTESLVHLLPVMNLRPGDVTQVTETVEVDICKEADFTTYVSVEANPENGLVCFDEDEYLFEINPPCTLSVSATNSCTAVSIVC